MIKPGEIQQKANAVGVRDQQIEKDYILSWILLGISKLESSANSATIDTILKVFKALKAEINFNVKLEDNFVKLA